MSETLPIIRTARIDATHPNGAAALSAALGDDLAATFAFASPRARFPDLVAGLAREMAGETVACTTAGEIAGAYVEDEIVGLGLPRAHFAASTYVIPDIDRIEASEIARAIVHKRRTLEVAHPKFKHEFAFLIVDGTSEREDGVVEVLSCGLGTMPLFGGSAGDGTRFEASYVGYGGQVMERGAVLTLVRTDCPLRVFSLNHLEPGTTRMVVTEADPEARLVMEINAAPAAQEYARLLGKDPHFLDPFTFAAHPLVVRVGGEYFVRSIQRITEEGHLKFFSAIDEGVVLTLANLKDIAAELERDFSGLTEGRDLEAILACDCVLRRIAAEQTQRTRAVGEVLGRHKVVGFSTYGEQVGAMHVNLTMTGVAFFRPPGAASG